MSEFWGITICILAATSIFGLVCWSVIYYLTYAVRTQTLGETTWCGNAKARSVALTFDDGPSPDTLKILEILCSAEIKATFFVVGKEVEKYPEIAKKIVEEGHEIGNHSYSHPIYLFCTPAKTRRELEKTQEIIKNVVGFAPKIVRPPCGVRTPAYFDAAKNLGLTTIQWSDAGFDWKQITSKKICENILKTVQSDSIILLHDSDSRLKLNQDVTVNSLPLILDGLKKKNLRVVPLFELCPQIQESKISRIAITNFGWRKI